MMLFPVMKVNNKLCALIPIRFAPGTSSKSYKPACRTGRKIKAVWKMLVACDLRLEMF